MANGIGGVNSPLNEPTPSTLAFTLLFTAGPRHIDELGHVNNAVWVQWMQDISVAHWTSIADPADIAAYFWVVTRHEIDYRGNIMLGESVTARTWISEPPRGVRFKRNIDFIDANGKVIVNAVSTWALMDKATGRITRVPKDMAARFLADT